MGCSWEWACILCCGSVRLCCAALCRRVLYTVLQGVSLRFEAEATGWLQNKNIPMTNDAAKYENKDVTAKVLAILTPGGLNLCVAGVRVLVAHHAAV